MVGVVAIHLGMSDTGFPIADIVSKLFSSLVPSSCVPLFFLISGFLFFWEVGDFNLKIYGEKMQNRFRSLVVPYFVWNTFMIACYAAVHFFVPEMTSAENENVLQYTLKDWIIAYWNKSGGQPVAFQLWLLRNLIVMSILSPLFWLLSRLPSMLRWMPLVIFVALESRIGFGWCCGVFYFYLGVLFSNGNTLSRINYLLVKIGRGGQQICVLSIFLIWIASVIINLNIDGSAIIAMARRFFGAFVFFLIAMFFTSKFGKINGFIENSGYFIYLFHAFPSFVFKKMTVMYILPSSTFGSITLYFARIAVMIGLCLLLYFALLKLFPCFTAVITGKKVVKAAV